MHHKELTLFRKKQCLCPQYYLNTHIWNSSAFCTYFYVNDIVFVFPFVSEYLLALTHFN